MGVLWPWVFYRLLSTTCPHRQRHREWDEPVDRRPGVRLTAGGYIKIAIVMAILCIAVVFMLVYRLLLLPTEPSAGVALQTVQRGTTSPVGVSVTPAASPSPTQSNRIVAEAKQFPNVHTSPGLSSPKVGVLNQGSQADVVGRTSDSVWLEIRYPQSPSGVGWVSTDLVSVSAPVASVPVVSSP